MAHVKKGNVETCLSIGIIHHNKFTNTFFKVNAWPIEYWCIIVNAKQITAKIKYGIKIFVNLLKTNSKYPLLLAKLLLAPVIKKNNGISNKQIDFKTLKYENENKLPQ